MATDVFPIYEVLVENVFGSVGLAIMGVALVLLLIMFLTRTSTIFLIYWMMFYFLVMGTLYFGALGLVLAFLISATYFTISLTRTLFPDR